MKVECSICGNLVSEADVCSTLVCRACHVLITFEDCINGTTPDELAWEAEKRAVGIKPQEDDAR